MSDFREGGRVLNDPNKSNIRGGGGFKDYQKIPFMNFYQGNKLIGKISKYRSSKDYTFALFEVLHRLFWQTCAESHKNVEEVHKKS